jgi:hypothetical protein
MAQLGYEFDAETVEPASSRDIIPAGDYKAQIVKSEMVATKDGTGQMLVLELEILSPGLEGLRVWDRLNLHNRNATAVEIAQRTLSAICRAVGQNRLTDSEMLHYKPMTIKVNVRPAGPDRNGVQRDASNEVRGYSPAAGAAPRVAASAAAPTPGPAPVTKPVTPPWRRAAAS